MIKIGLLFTCLFLCLAGPCQHCGVKEKKLLETFGGFSAAFLYNTYGMIGGIGDAYGQKAYDAETVNDLMDAQVKLIENLVKLVGTIENDSILSEEKDQHYAKGLIEILNGLKMQARLLQDYVRKKSRQKSDEYEEQGKKNWSAISRLMGVQE